MFYYHSNATRQASLYVNFVDFQKAFDGLARERIWQILLNHGVPEKFVCIIRNWCDNSEGAVAYEGSILDSFKVTTGVKQGSVISGFIFTIVLDWVMRRTVEEERTKWNTMGLQHRSHRSDICRRHRTGFKHLVSYAKEKH